jgi:nucleolar protein 14
MGTALSQLDDDDMHGSDESEGDDEDSGQLSAAQVAAHFGGPDSKNVYAAYQTDPNRPRTKEEIMKEVISKSKFHKLERQQDKADTDTLVNTLDEQFADIRRMMEYRPTKAEAPAAAVVQDDYDKRARELLFDPKVRATDRTKTDEEVAKLEFERLQKAEQQRLRRMKGEESEEEEEDEDGLFNNRVFSSVQLSFYRILTFFFV